MILYLVVWCVGSLPLGIVVGKALKARGGASPRLPATRPVSGADLPHPSVTVGPTFAQAERGMP